MTILVTGGAGFIGANFLHRWLRETSERVVNLDKLTYAGSPESLEAIAQDPGYVFVRGDIADGALVAGLLTAHRPRAVLNFAAESHVDRSIAGPAAFVQTNVMGTFALLEAVRDYWSGLPAHERDAFRFLHVSTDEVYGALGPADPPFDEASPHAPNSPYSASKAASDHFVRAYHRTYGLPVLTTHCSNNYGPRQHPEKFIPVVIRAALAGEPIPVYGSGENVRDWLYVADHCEALMAVLARGRPGETYNVGGGTEIANRALAEIICGLLDEMRPDPAGKPRARLIASVPDRPGHDFRYAIDCRKLAAEVGWRASRPLAQGLRETVRWYLDNGAWVAAALARLQETPWPRDERHALTQREADAR